MATTSQPGPEGPETEKDLDKLYASKDDECEERGVY